MHRKNSFYFDDKNDFENFPPLKKAEKAEEDEDFLDLFAKEIFLSTR